VRLCIGVKLQGLHNLVHILSLFYSLLLMRTVKCLSPYHVRDRVLSVHNNDVIRKEDRKNFLRVVVHTTVLGNLTACFWFPLYRPICLRDYSLCLSSLCLSSDLPLGVLQRRVIVRSAKRCRRCILRLLHSAYLRLES
jgi:hypothetical protein